MENNPYFCVDQESAGVRLSERSEWTPLSCVRLASRENLRPRSLRQASCQVKWENYYIRRCLKLVDLYFSWIQIKKHLRKIRHNYLLLLFSTFRPPFTCKFFLFRPNGMFIARHLRHLLVTGFVKNTPTTVINMIRITFTVLLFRVIVKEVILKVLLQIQSWGRGQK